MQKQCGSNAPRSNRYTKAELIAMAQQRGIATKSRDTLDQLCAKLGFTGAPAVPVPLPPPTVPLPVSPRLATSPRGLPAPAGTPGAQQLYQRLLEAQAQGKVLDVTFMKDNLAGTHIIAAPKTARSAKIRVPGLPMVSMANSAGLYNALTVLGPNYAPYMAAFQQAAAPGAQVPAVQPVRAQTPVIPQTGRTPRRGRTPAVTAVPIPLIPLPTIPLQRARSPVTALPPVPIPRSPVRAASPGQVVIPAVPLPGSPRAVVTPILSPRLTAMRTPPAAGTPRSPPPAPRKGVQFRSPGSPQ